MYTVELERFPLLSMGRAELWEVINKEIKANTLLKESLPWSGEDLSTQDVYDAKLDGNEWRITARHPLSKMILLDKEDGILNGVSEPNSYADRLVSARHIIARLQQREDTFLAIVSYLLERERELALGGPKKGGITARNLADILDLHPFTIEAAKKNIRVCAPGGDFILADFFDQDAEKSTVLSQGSSRILDPNETDSVTEICLIAPSWDLAELNRQICRMYGKHVDVCVANLQNAVDIVKKLAARGAKVFISRKGTRKKIAEQCSWPVVDIGTDLTDYVPFFLKASSAKGKVAFFSYGVVQEDVRIICHLMKIDALFYSFYQPAQCEGIVRDAVRAGAVLGIGGMHTAEPAAKLGLPHYILENSQLSVLQAIESAEQLLQIQKEEAAKQEELKILVERYDLALSFTHDAIFAVGADGTIEVMNEAAVSMAGTGGRKTVGKPFRDTIHDLRVDEVLRSGKRNLDHIIRLRGITYTSNVVPIIVDHKVKGVLATYQDVRALQMDEQNVRMKLAEKGLVARYHFEDIIGVSSKLTSAVRMAKRFAAADATVLIHGETGTGKELFAQSIHNASPRSGGPFVAVNCGALPKDILEAELFGYTEGAFTGARKGGRMGLFEMAHNGTIFLDEIGEMPMETQVQLLRVLQEKEIRRIGSDRVTPVNIRVIAATNRNLLNEIRDGHFRQDLFYRINVLNIEIPPLRERREDIAPICENLLAQLMPCGDEERKLLGQILKERHSYRWPGNVRQLSNLAERLYVLRTQGEDPEFIKSVLGSFSMETAQDNNTGTAYGEKAEFPAPVSAEYEAAEESEEEKLRKILEGTEYNITAAAKKLGINRSTLWRKMKRLGIKNTKGHNNAL